MKRILALHTGGTISMSQDENGEVTPNSANPIASTVGPLNNEIELINEELFNLPSTHITPKHMLIIKQRIQRAESEGIDGVVVTHGTDTLEETAYFLDLTLLNTIPVVMTGAMRSSNQVGADGLHNFQSAVLVAATAEAYGKGVLVVLNDEIHPARYVTKAHTTNVDTFKTPTFGPIGLIVEQKAVFFQKLLQSEVCDVDQVIDNVYLLQAYAGMSSFLFDAIDKPETKGVVIEGTGAGNMPPETLAGISKLLAHDIPIVLVSRCYDGVAQAVYGYNGGGIKLKEMGVTLCQGLNGPKARIKLLVGLSAGKTGTDLTNFVSDAIS